MSVNYYDSATKQLITLASGSRIWFGTLAAKQAEIAAGTMANNCLLCVIDDNYINIAYRQWDGTEIPCNTGGGISPTASVQEAADGKSAVLTVTDATGTTSVTIPYGGSGGDVPEGLEERLDDDEQNILALTLALTVLQQAQVDGTADNIAVETFETQSGFTILSGHYDSANHMLYA